MSHDSSYCNEKKVRSIVNSIWRIGSLAEITRRIVKESIQSNLSEREKVKNLLL